MKYTLWHELNPNNDKLMHSVSCPHCEHTVRYRWLRPFQAPMTISKEDEKSIVYEFKLTQSLLCEECGEEFSLNYGHCYWTVNKEPQQENKKLKNYCLADFFNFDSNYLSFGIYMSQSPYNRGKPYYYILIKNEGYENNPIFITKDKAEELINGPMNNVDVLAFIEEFFKD